MSQFKSWIWARAVAELISLPDLLDPYLQDEFSSTAKASSFNGAVVKRQGQLCTALGSQAAAHTGDVCMAFGDNMDIDTDPCCYRTQATHIGLPTLKSPVRLLFLSNHTIYLHITVAAEVSRP